jgi:RNA polymerase sigma-70 factor, ECF subfamily
VKNETISFQQQSKKRTAKNSKNLSATIKPMFDEAVKNSLNSSVNLSAKNYGELLVATDEDLVKAVLAGDELAFDTIFERYKKLAIHLTSRFFRQREEIEDIVQQSFTKVFFSLKDFRGGNEKSLPAWISKLTINVCYDELRKRKRKPENLFSDFSDDERNFLEQITDVKASGGEKKLVARDAAEKVLAGLNPKERLAMTLHYGEDYSVAEVAKIVGWTESNVKTRLFRCRKNLRSLFEDLFS